MTACTDGATQVVDGSAAHHAVSKSQLDTVSAVANAAAPSADLASTATGKGASLVGFIQSGTGAVPRTSLDELRDRVSAKQFGAKGDNTTDDSASINAAITFVAGLGGGTVLLPRGTYIVDSSVIMKANVRLLGDNGATITQRAGKNLGVLVDFTSSGNYAVVENVSVDGNRSNNTDNSSVALVHVRGSLRGEVRRCSIQNSCGYGVATNGVRTVFADNVISNCYMHGIAAYCSTGSAPQDAFLRVERNYLDTLCTGGLICGDSNYALIRDNRFNAVSIGGRGNRLTVNTSGTTVTWASGPKFDAIKPGMFAVLNNGQEFQITAVPNNTSLTVASTLPTLTGVAASVGTGDVMGIVASSGGVIANNIIVGGVTFGLGLSLGGASWSCTNNTVVGNSIHYSGKNGINVSWDSGTGILSDNAILDNKILNPGNSGGIASNDKIGIFIASQSSGKVNSTFVQGNSVTTASGDGQSEYWMGVDGLGAYGSVTVGRNYAVGMVYGGIKNDVVSTVLDAGWGSTASVSQIVSHGHTLTLAITAGGTGIVGGPAITINKICTVPESPIILDSKIQSTNGTLAPMWGEQTSTPGVWKSYYNGTPTSGSYYTIVFHA
jgi:hypothetical protein